MIRQLPLFPDEREHALTRRSTLADAIAPFLARLKDEGRSPHTIIAFAADLKLAAEFFGEDMRLDAFTTRKLARFMAWIESGRGAPCSRKSYARRVTTLKVFFKFLLADKVLPDDPAAALPQRSGAAPLQPILSDDEITRLLEYTLAQRVAETPDARPDLLLRLLLDTGIKKSETLRLTREDVVREDTAQPPRPGVAGRPRGVPGAVHPARGDLRLHRAQPGVRAARRR